MRVKVLVATSSVGSGVNLPIKTVLGWGLDPTAAGVVQASGRCARKHMVSSGNIIWVSIRCLFKNLFNFKVFSLYDRNGESS